MKLKPVPSEALGQHVEHAPRILFLREDEDQVVRVADEQRTASQPWLHVVREPLVHDRMQVDVREPWRDDPALRRASFWVRKPQAL